MQSIRVAAVSMNSLLGQPQRALAHQLADGIGAAGNGRGLHQRGLDPAAQATAAHGGHRAIEGPEQGAMQTAAQLGAGEFEVAPGLGIEHQLVAGVPEPRRLQEIGRAHV